MSEKKIKKPKMFQLATMNRLVDETPSLKTAFEKMREKAQDELGYHWNEVVKNVIFNRYVKTSPKLLAKYQVLLKQHHREKDALKASKGGLPGATPTASPAVPAANAAVNRRGQVDTRLTAESDTAGVGGSYETPYFLTTDKKAADKFGAGMASMVGATLLETPHMPSETPMLTESLAARALFNLEALDLLIESNFGGPINDQPLSQLRLDEIKAENRKSATAQFKQTKDQSIDFTQKLDDGSATIKVTNEIPSLAPQGHQTDDAEDKHVRLNRGLNGLDQTLIGQPNLPKSLLDRYREQAGVEFKNSEEKVEQYRKADPSARPPARTQIIKETYLFGRDPQGQLHRFELGALQHVSEIPTDATRLETRGLANGEQLLREGHEFYVNLHTTEFLCVPLAQAPALPALQVDRRMFEQLQHLTFYKSTK